MLFFRACFFLYFIKLSAGNGFLFFCICTIVYLTIRLRARDFYAVIVDEGEARINYHRIEIESE